MPNIPAICTICNKLFPSPIILGGGSGPNMFFGCTTRCPQCGEVAAIPDGLYTVFDDTIEFLSDGPYFIDRLRNLHSVVTRVINNNYDPQRAVEAIKETDPEFGSILPPVLTSPALAKWWLSCVASVLSIVISVDTYLNRPPSKAELQEMFEQTIERFYQPGPGDPEKSPRQVQPETPRSEPYHTPIPHLGDPRPKPLEPYRAPPKPGRNEPCPCGSGKKFKHCCQV